jgi:hypothetical protein
MGLAGLGCVSLVTAIWTDGLASQGYWILANPGVATLVADFLWGFTFLAIYGWIFTNINIALAADFLHRDALGWRRGGRYVMVAGLLVPYLSVSIPSSYLPISAAAQVDLQVIVSFWFGLIFTFFTAYAALVLGIAFRRIRDLVIKRYMKWVGITILAVIGDFIVMMFTPIAFPFLLVGYAAYRAAGSLAIRTHNISQPQESQSTRRIETSHGTFVRINMIPQIQMTVRSLKA